MEKQQHDKHKAADNLYLLAFIDIVDRLDILMLEIRHLQQTIIHALKAPTLYLPLRFEEAHLFGDNWHHKLSSSSVGDDFDLVTKWVIRYPIPKNAVIFYYKNPKKPYTETTKSMRTDEKIALKLNYRIGKIWMGDNWVRDQRRQYHALCALQILKQQVLRDKIALARAALQADLVTNKAYTRRRTLQKPAFLILREGVLRQVDIYISVLRNHKHQVGQSIDFGMPTDPHPSIERRREMGIFMDFIFNRTLDVQRDIIHLCSHFNRRGTQNKKKDKEANGLWMFHGWSQNTNVSTIQLDDKINAFYNYFGSLPEKQTEEHIGYVNTSFWTPDRPDLHPLIAYPVAKSVIRNHLGGLDEVNLSNSDDNFTELIIKLKSVFINATNSLPFMRFLKPQLEKILNKIAADLLATSVKGVSYLYALFLSTIARDLASQLYVGKEIKLEMVYALEQGTACYNDAMLAYLRLNLTALWAKEVLYDLSPLDQQIIAGVREVTQDLLGFLNRYTPLNRQRTAPHWESLLASLQNEMIRSATIQTNKQWCEKRATDNNNHKKNTHHTKKHHQIIQESKRRFPRSSRSLNIRLQNYLFRALLQLKQSSNKKALYKHKNIPYHGFEEEYGLSIESHPIPEEKDRALWHPKSLFSHIYAIPYQSAFLRSIDMLNASLSDEDFFQQIHWDMELGRSLFAFALEFHARETESPEQRLSLCVNQVAYAYQRIKTITNLEAPLRNWLSAGNEDEMLSQLAEIDKKIVQKFCDNPKILGATRLVTAFEQMPLIRVKETRYLELVAGHKLKELLDILLNLENYMGHTHAQQLFTALVQFLSIRPRHHEITPTAPKKRLFYNRMLTALGDIDEQYKNEYEQLPTTTTEPYKHYLPEPISSMLIKRLSMTNFYPVSDPLALTSPLDNENGMTLAQQLKHKQWQTHFNYHAVQEDQDYYKRRKKGNTWITLGRFDAISMIKVKLPCKCYIQGFNDQVSLPHKNDDVSLNEAFSPHFSRREIARPVKLLPEPNQHQMFAIINVILQRRSIRLDFLYRLVRALMEEYPVDFQSDLEKNIKQLKQQHIYVTGFLTDGWGDILFKFSKAVTEQGESQLTEQDIAHIFNFQTAIYEDFMVDRTEITFTPACLDYTLGMTKTYRISIEARMMEDRWLENGICNYTKTLGILKHHLPIFLRDVDITMLPGRNDFKFTFSAAESVKNNVIEDVFINIIEWLEGSTLPKAIKQANQKTGEQHDAMRMLSHLETYIERHVIFDDLDNLDNVRETSDENHTQVQKIED